MRASSGIVALALAAATWWRAPSASAELGARCASVGECGSGETCLTAGSGAFDGGGPAGGVCTKACVDAADCGGNVCVTINAGGDAFCFESCAFGPPGTSAFDPVKCHGRSEMSCMALWNPTAVTCATAAECSAGQHCFGTCYDLIPTCQPSCNADTDCGPGLHCDPGASTCVPAPKAGLGLGAACDLPGDGSTDACRGWCGGVVDETGASMGSICFENCTNGAPNQCGWAGPGSGPAAGYCLYANSAIISQFGVGDRGSCGALCDCDSDCLNPNAICFPLGNFELEQTLERRGYCFPTVPGPNAPVGIPECPEDAGAPLDPRCVFGATKACRGPGGCVGSRLCLDGGYGECTCAPSPPDSGPDAPPDAPTEAGEAGADAGTDAAAGDASADATSDGSVPAQRAVALEEAGCACATPGSPGRRPSGLAAFAAAALVLAGRRRDAKRGARWRLAPRTCSTSW